MNYLREKLQSVVEDWRENWRRYVRNGILLFLIVQLAHACANWLENSIDKMV